MGWSWLDRTGLEDKERQGWAAQRLEVQRTEVLRGENHNTSTHRTQSTSTAGESLIFSAKLQKASL